MKKDSKTKVSSYFKMIPKITAADIKDYEYDPRLFYFKRIIKVPYQDTAKTLKGKEKDVSFKRDTSRNKIIKGKSFNPSLIRKYHVSLETEEYATNVDCILINEKAKEAYPLQRKYSKKPACGYYRTMKLQLMFEAMLIEKIIKYKVPYGYIKYELTNDLVKVNLEDRQELFEIINQIKTLLSNETIPAATKYKKRLVDNCYGRFY